MDDAGKQRIKAALAAHATEALEALRAQVAAEDVAARVGQDDTVLTDDLSQADEAGDLGALLEESVSRQEAGLKNLEQLDFSPTETVRPGAVITFGGASYVVGVVADEFQVDGVTYEGISAGSPIGAAVEGLRAGDTFTFDGGVHTLDAVV